jgi:hypothetical protein
MEEIVIDSNPSAGTTLVVEYLMPIRILITDDHGVIRAGLRALLGLPK